MTTVSAATLEPSPWCKSSSALKYAFAMEAAVTAGSSSISGVMLPSGDRSAEGDMRFAELARRGGATPLAECREFKDAFRSRVGVAERESRPFDPRLPFKGLRGAPRLLATLGDRLMVGLAAEAGLGEERGDLTGEGLPDKESCLRVCDKSVSAFRPLLMLFVDSRRRGDELGWEAIVNAVGDAPGHQPVLSSSPVA